MLPVSFWDFLKTFCFVASAQWHIQRKLTKISLVLSQVGEKNYKKYVIGMTK
jgi:hypothetical protein